MNLDSPAARSGATLARDCSKFSIVTPSFGQIEWLELCVASVAAQASEASGLFVEHIVCDAGTPGIGDFRERMLERYPAGSSYSLVFEIGPDAGMYDAINKGLRMATGEICSYLNCDEQLLPGALSCVRNFFTSHPRVDVVFGDAIVVGRDGSPLCYWRPYVPSAAHLAGATLNTLSCSTFFRRRLVEEGHLFEPGWKVVGDLLWVRGLLRDKCPMSCLRVPLAAFTFLGDNLGAGETARVEFAQSRENLSSLRRQTQRGVHALRKLLSGAYVRRPVSYDLFVLSDPLHPSHFVSSGLGWRWPGVAASR